MTSSFEKLWDDLLGRDTVARIRVVNATLTRIGGYNARPYSSELGLQEKPRSQAIRGVWRWWARALLAGAWYEKYGNFPRGIRDLDEMVAPVLGSTGQASKLFVRVSVEETAAGEAEAQSAEAQRARDIARLKLFRPPRGEDEQRYREEENPEKYFSPHDLAFTVELVKRPHAQVSREEEAFSIRSLVLSLVLGGVGSITNRGFGSTQLKILRANGDGALASLLGELYSAENSQAVRERLDKLVNSALEAAGEYLNYLPGGQKSAREGTRLPRYPVLSRKGVEVGGVNAPLFRLEVACRSFESPLDALIQIGNATLKASWKRVLGFDPKAERGGGYHTWILGLPRSSVIRGRRTGYTEKTERGYQDPRRQSAISFSVIPSRGSYYVAVYGFLSFDWLDLLRRGSFVRIGEKEESVCSLLKQVKGPGGQKNLSGLSEERRLVEVFDTAWSFVMKSICGEGEPRG